MEEDKETKTDANEEERQRRLENLRRMLEPTLKKKDKMRKVFGEEQEISNEQRKSQYSKNSRRKHKEYVTELERKVEMLEKKVIELTSLIEKYKQKEIMIASGFEDHHSSYAETDKHFGEYYRGDLKSEGKEEVIDKYINFFNLHGPFGKYRILAIKNSFRNIIEALVPNIMISHMQFARIEDSWNNEDYNNLWKLTRKQAIVELKESKYSNIDRRMYDKAISPRSREIIRKRDPILL